MLLPNLALATLANVPQYPSWKSWGNDACCSHFWAKLSWDPLVDTISPEDLCLPSTFEGVPTQSPWVPALGSSKASKKAPAARRDAPQPLNEQCRSVQEIVARQLREEKKGRRVPKCRMGLSQKKGPSANGGVLLDSLSNQLRKGYPRKSVAEQSASGRFEGNHIQFLRPAWVSL